MIYPDFEVLQKLATERGLQARCFNRGNHWQIIGGPFTVNYYPTAGSIYLNGYARKTFGDIQYAIELAFTGFEGTKIRERKGRYSTNGTKKRMFNRSQSCHWCKKSLTLQTATIDHLVPLSKGGSNASDNLVLSCHDCNQKRKNLLPSSMHKSIIPHVKAEQIY